MVRLYDILLWLYYTTPSSLLHRFVSITFRFDPSFLPSIFKGNTYLGQYPGGGGLLIANNFGDHSSNITVNRCLFADNTLGPGSFGGQGAGLAFQVASLITVKYCQFIHNALVSDDDTDHQFLSLSTVNSCPFLLFLSIHQFINSPSQSYISPPILYPCLLLTPLLNYSYRVVMLPRVVVV